MDSNYTATIYCEEEIIAYKQGDDVEELYLWMLTHASDKGSSGVYGEIVDLKTREIIRQFRKSSVE